jgi:3-methyladenine DNA glycosylase/8-oxoguanine DNA glycosylase
MPKKPDHTTACEFLSRTDRQLARVIERAGECLLLTETTQSIFEALLESIIYQQLNGKVAAIITERVKALFPENIKQVRTRRGLVAAFPTPEQILGATEEHLRSAGLSRAKMLAIRDLAAKTLDGTVPTVKQAHRMSDDELVERLVSVRGIGRWTVEMLLIFRLGRPDVLPVNDYGVRKGFARMRKLEELPKPKELMAYGERWRPYRSVASWYLWRAADAKEQPVAGKVKKATGSVEEKPVPRGRVNPASPSKKNSAAVKAAATKKTAGRKSLGKV